MKINKKGFAVSSMLYGLIFTTVAIFYLIIAVVSNRYETNVNFVDSVRRELSNSYSMSSSYSYTGSVQTFIVPKTGIYRIELWGAQGGNDGGLGSYVSGDISLTESTILNIYVGGAGIKSLKGANGYTQGGYNGGGYTLGQDCCGFGHERTFGTGGGATDVRIISSGVLDFNSLKSRIIVAAGGGGRFTHVGDLISAGGAGGGLIGASGVDTDWCAGQGGTQNQGGEIGTTGLNCDIIINAGYTDPGKVTGSFGIGGNHGTQGNASTGGGGGYYGGSSSGHIAGAGGGSSYISGHNGCNAILETSTANNIIHSNQSVHYSGYKFTNTLMIDGDGYKWTNIKGSYVGMPTHDGKSTMTGNEGNGYAKITFISIN